ncbi:S1 RNA-binding domain-containing protein [Streptomyces sp. NPDC048332]|uniref:S1 RNA-binding domain-containing protein n=1 Tax=Streptomyces sp. NPDC048332 TaxID=3154619 RepID=UPI0034209622
MAEMSKAQVRRAKLEGLEAGEVCTGVVSGIEPFGVFVDIGGLDGMVNATELSWTPYEAMSDIVEIGQEVTVVVLGVDLHRERCALSLNALRPDPLPEFARTHFGRVVTGRVKKVVEIGAFVQVDQHYAGLVPWPELADHMSDPEEYALQVGDEVTVEVVAINLVHRRILLSLRP